MPELVGGDGLAIGGIIGLVSQEGGMEGWRDGGRRIKNGELGAAYIDRCWFDSPLHPTPRGELCMVWKEIYYAKGSLEI